ncbi:MAG: methyltransferase [Candidatus Woesearchaeota archaeon]|nr:methyltransferase [Candidatus Woesearchaeota archaeon]
MEHYFSENPKAAASERTFSALLRGNRLSFVSSGGVFSKSEIDKGTELLIEKCIMKDGWRVLDLGCGYGTVGVVIAKAFNVEVVMSDVNERALMLAGKNLERNRCSAHVIKSFNYDSLSDFKGMFDSILVNPPQKAGKEICLKMIDEAPLFMKKGGFLQVVARPKRGGNSLAAEMKRIFGNCEKIAEKGEFAVYASMKK